MADKEPAEELEPVPVEGAEEQQADANADDDADEPQPPTIEALAAELGWAAQDQWRGDPEAWKPADEFIRDTGKINKNLSRDLRELRSTVDGISRTSASIVADKIAERDAYWKAKRDEAIELGDKEAVDHADEQRQALRKQAQPDPVLERWLDENKWMEESPEAAAMAWGVCQRNQHLEHKDQLRLAREEVLKRFPEYAAQGRPAPAVSKPGSRSASTTGRKKGFHDLPPDAQKVARDMAERGVIPSVEAYTARYFENERKVG